MQSARTRVGALGGLIAGLTLLVLLGAPGVAPVEAEAASTVNRETRNADRAVTRSLREMRANRTTRATRELSRVRRHTTRARRASTRRVFRASSGRRARTSQARRVSWLRSVSHQKARSSERLAGGIPRSRGRARRSAAAQVSRDSAGWRRSSRRWERDVRRLRGSSRRRAERQLVSFLRGRLSRSTRLQGRLEAEGQDAAGRRVLTELGRNGRAAERGLRRLGALADSSPAEAGTQPAGGSSQPDTGAAPQAQPSYTPEPGTLLSDRFDRAFGPNNLITNHFAFLHHTDGGLPRSPVWEVTNGTLFHQGGTGWTGNPTACSSDRYSEVCTGSARFRMQSRSAGLGDVSFNARFRHNSFTHSSELPATPGDGIHVWLRHQSQAHLYRVNVVRRNGQASIQKKCPGGTANNGTYHLLAQLNDAGVASGQWHDVTATARNVSGGVALALSVNGRQLVTVTDTGVGCAPITGSGRVGIRGDNSDFNVDDVLVRPI